MNITIKLEDYLSADEIKEIAKEEGKALSEIRGEELSSLWQKAKEKTSKNRG